jgi:hypothetical protein
MRTKQAYLWHNNKNPIREQPHVSDVWVLFFNPTEINALHGNFRILDVVIDDGYDYCYTALSGPNGAEIFRKRIYTDAKTFLQDYAKSKLTSIEKAALGL